MLDTIHTWDRPITIRIGEDAVAINTPMEARHVLLIDWPAERTDKHKVASQLCLDAMQGADSGPAWLAFLEAALEAEIFIE